MIKTGHPTAESARTELANEGYRQAFSSPGRPALYIKKHSKRYAVAELEKARSSEWLIVPYPEPSVVNANELSALLEAESDSQPMGASYA